MKLSAINKIAKRLSRRYGIVNPPEVLPLKYSRFGECVALGYYDEKQNTVEIHKYALEVWKQKEIQDLLKHELVHALCYQEYGHTGHGKRFTALCNRLGLVGDVILAKSKEVH
ncbi:SprT-like domain-containing protein [Candidatus Pacearchaeota archaeon]|jgi:predicted SprT family Zn-dependent metalloprotease|nr:SprT-like domain-containing protein [Candidatus Pacearchaeota archaeon]